MVLCQEWTGADAPRCTNAAVWLMLATPVLEHGWVDTGARRQVVLVPVCANHTYDGAAGSGQLVPIPDPWPWEPALHWLREHRAACGLSADVLHLPE